MRPAALLGESGLYPLELVADTVAYIASPLIKLYGVVSKALIGMEHLRLDTTVA